MTTISLPIETEVRELDGKLWLALHLAREGARVYLGPDRALGHNAGWIAPDVHLLNSGYSTPDYEATASKVSRVGGRLAVLDTEGGLYRSREAYATRLSPSLLSRVDHFLAWGPDPASIVRETMGGHARPEVIVTGNPAFDLLRSPTDSFFDAEAEALANEFGRFVLVNTNFGYANPFTRSTVNRRTETLERRQMEELLLQRLLDLLRALANAYPTRQFVVRPHPSENHGTYRHRLADIANVQVHHRGPVAPWLKACALLVHNACTTGVEAALLGRRVLAYCPTRYHMEEFSVANGVSERIGDDADLIARVGECLDEAPGRRPLAPEPHAFLARFIANADHSATERIVRLFLDGRAPPARPRRDLAAVPMRALVTLAGERGLDRLRAARGERAATQLKYVRQKFPGLSRGQLEARIGRMARVDPSLGRARVRKARGLEHTYVVEAS